MKIALKKFLAMEASGGITLLIATALALLCSNSFLAPLYQNLFELPVYVGIGNWDIHKPLLLWINDGLMALFFVVVSLEVKRELVEGALSSREKAIFPAVAAIGGMVAPAAIYLLFNHQTPETRAGWAIPAATDIAFALGVMTLLGKRVLPELKIFLLALAIIDDLGVIVIIALFYTDQLAVEGLMVASGCFLILWLLNYFRVGRTAFYVLVGIVMWVAVLKSGVHATLAGVVLGFMIPLYDQKGDSPLKRIEHHLHPWSSFFILPLFAFANAGVSLQGISVSTLTTPLPLGIILGLVLGKPLGIWTLSWLAVKAGIVKLPPRINFWHIAAVGCLCGIGFTMSMFIASLAFEHSYFDYGGYARLGILIGSCVSAILGLLFLYFALKTQPRTIAHGQQADEQT